MTSIDFMLGTHFTEYGIEIGKCNQDSNHSLSKQVSSKILGSIDLCICGGNNFFITSLGGFFFFFFFLWWLEKIEISNYNKCKLLIFTQKVAYSKVSLLLPLSHFVCSLFHFRMSQNIVMFLKIKIINLLMFLLYPY